MYGNDMTFLLCQILERNIADEAEAREGYYKIFECFAEELSEREKQEIREIIAEELKHSEILARMVYRRTGIAAES